MIFRAEGPHIEPILIDALSSLTDGAQLSARTVMYDSDAGTVTIPIRRCSFGRRKFRRGVVRRRGVRILSKLVIRHVTGCTIQSRIPDEEPDDIVLLFGLQAGRETIDLCSADESRGETRYTLHATVSEMDIEIIDMEDSE